MGASLGNLGEGSYARGLCVEEASGTGVCPYRGPLGNLERGSVYWELRELAEGGLWLRSISGNSVRGTWKGGSLLGDL